MDTTCPTTPPQKVHKDFRLWLTSLPSNNFPVSILQNGSKMTIEPPRGIKANLQKTYLRLTNDFISSSSKVRNLPSLTRFLFWEHWVLSDITKFFPLLALPQVTHFKSLLLSLCLFHGIALERRKFGPLGFNIPYEFTDGDLNICVSQLKMFLDEYEDIPYKVGREGFWLSLNVLLWAEVPFAFCPSPAQVLKYTAGEINYGGRVTDDWDRRCLLSVLDDFYCPSVLTDDHVYSSSGVYRQIDTNLDIKVRLKYSRSWKDECLRFCLH